MSNFLKDRGEIEDVWLELENGVSEGDSIGFDNNLGDRNDISEVFVCRSDTKFIPTAKG